MHRLSRRKNGARSTPHHTALSQAPLVLSHRPIAAVSRPGKQAGADAGDASATQSATLAAQPRTGDTPTDAQSGLRGVPFLFGDHETSCRGWSHVWGQRYHLLSE